MVKKSRVLTLVAAVILLAGCSSATEDRTSGKGKSPDASEDASRVKVFYNADKVPNIAIFCITPSVEIGPIAIMSTLSGSDGGTTKASAITRMPELDVPYCGGKPK
jgi:PBP1b-binding outer membrane lipoprotein LpoB